jgi:hypothetical protein
LAVGAWIGQTVLDAAAGRGASAASPLDLLRLHADVVLLGQTAAAGDVAVEEHVRVLLVRLDAAVDVVVGELVERGRR